MVRGTAQFLVVLALWCCGMVAAAAQQLSSVEEAAERFSSSVVYIEAAKYPTGKPCTHPIVRPSKGTGVIVGPRHVLTALHVVQSSTVSGTWCAFAYRPNDATPLPLLIGDRPALGAGWDLALIEFRDQLPDGDSVCAQVAPSLLLDPISAFVFGYDGEETGFGAGLSPPTIPRVEPRTVPACSFGDLCAMTQPSPKGFSGGPIINSEAALVGVMVESDGNANETRFEPVAGHAEQLGPLCKDASPRAELEVLQRPQDGLVSLNVLLLNVPPQMVPNRLTLQFTPMAASPIAGNPATNKRKVEAGLRLTAKHLAMGTVTINLDPPTQSGPWYQVEVPIFLDIPRTTVDFRPQVSFALGKQKLSITVDEIPPEISLANKGDIDPQKLEIKWAPEVIR